MSEEPEALRARLGRVGAWTFAFDAIPVADVRAAAAAIESLGYSALWVPEGARDIFAHLATLLAATRRLTVASGIANVTCRTPDVMEAGMRTLADGYPERVAFGLGIGHAYSTEARGIEWTGPLSRMRAYLDGMDASDDVPAPRASVRRLLAALGDRMLGLAAERALGAHTYFVPASHTARARDVLGPGPVIAVELTSILEPDPSRARRIARGWAKEYLELPNYANNLRRLGFSEDDVGGRGSDRLIDATIAHGDVDAIAARVREHLDAGADHVCVQPIEEDEADPCVRQLRELAPALLSL